MKYKKTVIKNGMRIITVPQKDAQAVTVLIMVSTGSNYEDKNIGGISHFLEHLCFKGTEKRPTATGVSTELDSLGAVSNAFTSNEYTGYYAKSNPKHMYKILEIVSDIYLNSTFPEAEIEKEKGVIIDEINMYEDNPPRKVHDVYNELLYGDQPSGRSILGTKENIKQMTRDDIVAYREKHYVPEATTIVVSGKFKESDVIKEIKKIFDGREPKNKIKSKKTIENQSVPQIKVHFKETDQTHIVLGVRSYSYFDKRRVVGDVMATILGSGMSSRLFKKLRDEMGVGYYVKAQADESYDYGSFYARTGVDNSRALEVVKAIVEEMEKLNTELVPDAELNKAKEYSVGSMRLSLETSDSLGEFYGDQEILLGKIKTPNELEEEIRKVTAKDIKKLAKQIFINEGLNLAMIGPISDIKEYKKALRFK